MQRPWPHAVDRLIGGPGMPVDRRAHDRWTVGPMTIWRAEAADGAEGIDLDPADLDRRIDAVVELVDRLDGVAPFPVARVRGRAGGWLVVQAPAGERADRPERHGEPGSLARALGVGLAALHGLPLRAVGRDRSDDGWAPIVERCRARVAAGAVDPGRLPQPYARYGAERLLELLEAGGAAASDRPGPAGADRLDGDRPVLCHGSPTLDRVLVDGGRFAGFDGVETALVADRHLDLAVAHRSVADLLGAEAVLGLYEGYGVDPDLGRLDRAVLASLLLGSGIDEPAPR